jgi:hypothetical protein
MFQPGRTIARRSNCSPEYDSGPLGFDTSSTEGSPQKKFPAFPPQSANYVEGCTKFLMQQFTDVEFSHTVDGV